MRSVYLISALLVMALLAIACEEVLPILDPGNLQPEAIVVTTDKLVYLPLDTVRVTVHNNSDKTIFLEGCNPIYVSTSTDTGWATAALHVCVWEGFAIPVLPHSTYEEQHEASIFNELNRFLVPVYHECLPDKPISQAHCASMEKIVSPPFVIAAKP